MAPPWRQPPDTEIAPSREDAISQHKAISRTHGPTTPIFYTDGSSTDRGVGASAVLADGEGLRKHLGSPQAFNVYVAELTGVQMSLTMLSDHPHPGRSQAYIFTDNQAAITACANPQPQSGQFILRRIEQLLQSTTAAG